MSQGSSSIRPPRFQRLKLFIKPAGKLHLPRDQRLLNGPDFFYKVTGQRSPVMLLVVVQATLNCGAVKGIDLRAVLRLPIVVIAVKQVLWVKAQVA